MNIQTTNDLDFAGFVRAFGNVFEHSPWVAERAFAARPFADVCGLHAAMIDVVEAATRDEKLALLRAHPELAGREAQAGTMTSASLDEQASAGLDRLTGAELRTLGELNTRYRDKHGFPFIVAVRHYTKEGIFHTLRHRLANDSASEQAAALAQVYAITGLRLAATFAAPPEKSAAVASLAA